jgi:thiamine-monophosphate kinase
MKLREIGEFGFIDRIKDGCFIREKNVIKAIGDDCCVFRSSPGLVTILTTDMLVEDIHFLRRPMPPFKLGRKSMAVNISDIAAMGGAPREAVVSIAIPADLDVEYLDKLYDGMKDIAREFDINLLGGDTTSAPQHLVINIALAGEEKEDELLYRAGAKAGDIVFLTGTVGSSAAGLDILLAGRQLNCAQPTAVWQGELLEAHFNPEPHVKSGRIIASSKKANSMIDVSDGVASDLGHICFESGVGAIIEESKIPVTEAFKNYIAKFNLDFEYLALHVGEDYVLLGTAPEESERELKSALMKEGCDFHTIGRIVEGSGINFIGRDGKIRNIAAKGFDHFAQNQRHRKEHDK